MGRNVNSQRCDQGCGRIIAALSILALVWGCADEGVPGGDGDASAIPDVEVNDSLDVMEPADDLLDDTHGEGEEDISADAVEEPDVTPETDIGAPEEDVGGPPVVDCSKPCDDGSICTVDACDPTKGCVHFPIQCSDGDACTIDGCHPASGCTFTPYSCDDLEDCTEDICYGNGLCKNIAPQCEDGNACTLDTCEAGVCAYLPVACDDGDDCTVDVCKSDVGCTVDPNLNACCETDAECEDSYSCTVGSCVAGLCQQAIATPGVCCVTDSDCAGGGACQVAFCANFECKVVGVTGPGCCASSEDCDDGDPCTTESCVQSACVHSLSCCVSDEDCDSGDPVCAQDICLGGTCIKAATQAAECCTESLFAVDFEGGSMGGLLFYNATELAGVGWKVVPTSKAKQGVWVLYYGNPVTQNYHTPGSSNAGVAVSPPIALPVGVRSFLEFQLRMEVQLGTYSDRFLVRLRRIKGGVTEAKGTLVWTKKGFFQANQWVPISLDLSAWAGETVQIEFDFDTFVVPPMVGEGVFIDQLVVRSTCAPLLCNVADDCNDSLFSTVPSCKGGHCVYVANPLNCEVHADCEDGNPCTSDLCGDYQCFNVPQAWCCNEDADCVDAFACTTDKCILTATTPFCSHNWQSNCCDVDAQGKLLFCDDNNPCTLDSCPEPGTPCVHQPIAGCCQKNSDCDDGSSCTVDLCDNGTCAYHDLCCGSDDDCDDGDDACTAEACVKGQCDYVKIGLETCCLQALADESFDGPSGAVKLTASPAPPSNAPGWRLSTTGQSYSTPGAVWFGNPVTGTYEGTGTTSKGLLKTVSPLPVPILTYTTLGFRVWMGVEYAFGAYPNADFDRLVVSVQPLAPQTNAATGSPIVLWDSGWGAPQWWEMGPAGAPLGPAWTLVDNLDLTPWSGQSIHLLFEFDSKDQFNNDFPGVYLDDIRVERLCGLTVPGGGAPQ